jgi:hypothetical protein
MKTMMPNWEVALLGPIRLTKIPKAKAPSFLRKKAMKRRAN